MRVRKFLSQFDKNFYKKINLLSNYWTFYYKNNVLYIYVENITGNISFLSIKNINLNNFKLKKYARKNNNEFLVLEIDNNKHLILIYFNRKIYYSIVTNILDNFINIIPELLLTYDENNLFIYSFHRENINLLVITPGNDSSIFINDNFEILTYDQIFLATIMYTNSFYSIAYIDTSNFYLSQNADFSSFIINKYNDMTSLLEMYFDISENEKIVTSGQNQVITLLNDKYLFRYIENENPIEIFKNNFILIHEFSKIFLNNDNIIFGLYDDEREYLFKKYNRYNETIYLLNDDEIQPDFFDIIEF